MNITVNDLIEKLNKLDRGSFIYFSREEDLEDEIGYNTFNDIQVKIPMYSFDDKTPEKEYIIVVE